MKIKLFICLALLNCSLQAYASDLLKIEYKNIKNNEKIFYDGTNWTNKVSRKNTEYFQKRSSEYESNYSDYFAPSSGKIFSTGTGYEFINRGRLIGYSNYDLKFYEYELDKDLNLFCRELTAGEVEELFPKYKVVRISDFSQKTNGLKIKRGSKNLKLILLNDTDRFFYNYSFTTNNSKFDEYEIKGFLCIKKNGMIQFSKFGENTKNTPWYVLLIR